MSSSDPLRSLSQQVWSWVLGLLALLVVLNVVWALLQPLLPVLAVGAVLVGGLTVWQRRRWR